MAASDPFRIRRTSSQPQMSPSNPQTLTLTVDDYSSANSFYRRRPDSGLYLGSSIAQGGGSPGGGDDSIVASPISSSRSSSSTSSSSVLLTIQEWVPSCFSKNKKAAPVPVTVPAQFMRKEMWDPGLPEVGDGKKPLRESDVAAAPEEVAVAVASVEPSSSTAAAEGAMKKKEKEKEREFVWAYKYRPRSLNEFICNQDQVKELLEMVRNQHCPHFIFEGPPGVGKRTMVLAFIRNFVGLEKLKTRSILKKIELKGESIPSIDVNLKISSKHVEVNLSELHGYEKNVIVSLVNESRARSGKSGQCDYSDCTAIVLHEADRISSDAQHYLSWMMEKYKGCAKIFFCCSNSAKLQTIKSLCQIVKLQQPSNTEIVEVLKFISKKECIELPHHMAERIAENSKNNLRQAIRSFEASWKFSQSFTEDYKILTGWEEDIANIAKSIVREQSPRQLYIIRGKLKKLIEHNVSPDFIFETLYFELKRILYEPFHGKLDSMYLEYKMRGRKPLLASEKDAPMSLNKQVNLGDKSSDRQKVINSFMKIEEFTAKFMSFYKSACNTEKSTS